MTGDLGRDGIRHGAADRTREAMRERGWSDAEIQEWFAPLRSDGGDRR